MNVLKRVFFAGLAALAAAGMAGAPAVSGAEAETEGKDGPSIPVLDAVRADIPPAIDGRLDDAVWERAPAYPLRALPEGTDKPLADAGSVRFAWDEDGLYLAAEMDDRDVVALGKEDGVPQHTLGDVVELFLWYEPDTYYWEFHATPAGRQGTALFPSPGLKIVELAWGNDIRFRLGARVDGQLNAMAGRDRGFTLELAVPSAELTKFGAPWGPGASWRAMVCRGNYGRHLPDLELSALAPLGVADFHRLAEYARLRLSPAAPSGKEP